MTTAQENFLVERRGFRKIARILALIWSCCWILFGLLSGVGENIGTENTLIHATLPGIIYLAITVFTWKYDGLGGLLILLAGFVTTMYFILQPGSFSVLETVFVLLYTTAPALLIGFLFIFSWRKMKRGEALSQSS